MISVFWNRLSFQFLRLRIKISLALDNLIPARGKKQDRKMEEIISMLPPEVSQEIETSANQESRQHFESEPVLKPEQTMVFYSGPKHQCSIWNVKRCRETILKATDFAADHGINTYIVNITSPFGLLAMEMLCNMRMIGFSCRLYSVRAELTNQRKSWRLLRETDMEFLRYNVQCDYRYYQYTPEEIRMWIYPQAGYVCDERGVRCLLRPQMTKKNQNEGK